MYPQKKNNYVLKLKNKLALASILSFVPLFPMDSLANSTPIIGISETFIYDTNPNMFSANKESIKGFATKLFLGLDNETETSKFKSEFAVTRNQFNDSSFNSTDFLLNTNYEKNLLRWDYGIGAMVRYDTTRDEDITNSGIITRSDNRLTLKATPHIGYQVSSLTKLSLAGLWQSIYYDDNNLTDYTVVSLTPTATYNLHPLHTLFASIQIRHYKALENAEREVNSIGPYLGWSYKFRPKYTLNLFAGALASKFKGYAPADDEWQVNPTYSAKVNYDGEKNNFSVGVTRSREASINGTEYDQTKIQAQNLFTINPIWSLTTKLSYTDIKQSNVTLNDLENSAEEYMSLNYNLSTNWVVSLSQQYKIEELQSGDQEERAVVKLNLTYKFGDKKTKY